MKNSCKSLLILSLASLFAATTAWAGGVNFASDSGTNPIQWKVPNVKYLVNPAGSADITNGSDLEAVDEAFSDWCDLSCSTIQANYDGTTGTQNMLTNGNSDGNSDVTWVEDSSWKYGSGVLGITSPLFYTNGTIIEADIALNGLDHTWTTANPFNKVDTKSIVLHEVGHWYGIQHYLLTDYPANDPPTMAPAWGGTTQTRTLEDVDILPFCYLYGDKSCGSESDCPYVIGGNSGSEYIAGQYACEGGQCVWNGGGGGSSGGGTSGGGGDQNSCDGYCNNQAPGGCYCDPQCDEYNDCCSDYIEICVNGGTSGGSSGGEEGSGEEGSGEEGSSEEGGGPTDPNGDCPGDMGFEGCCADLVLTWCDNGAVQELACNQSCGWDATNGFYNCNVDPVADPSGTFPLSCSGGEGTPPDPTDEGGGTTTGGESEECDGIGFNGCCNGLTLTWCESGNIQTLDCVGSCGWAGEKGYYDCNQPAEADPSGNNPLICPGGDPVPDPGETGGEASEETGGEASEEAGGEASEETGGDSPGPEGGSEGEEGGGATGGDIVLISEGSETTPPQTTEPVTSLGDLVAIPSLGNSQSKEGGCQTPSNTPNIPVFALLFMGCFLLRRRQHTLDRP